MLFHSCLAFLSSTESMKMFTGVCTIALTILNPQIYQPICRWGFCNAYVSNIRRQVPHSISRICRNCFHICLYEEVYQRHIELCFEFEAATIKMPNDGIKVLTFNNCQSTWFAPFVIHFDSESLIKPGL